MNLLKLNKLIKNIIVMGLLFLFDFHLSKQTFCFLVYIFIKYIFQMSEIRTDKDKDGKYSQSIEELQSQEPNIPFSPDIQASQDKNLLDKYNTTKIHELFVQIQIQSKKFHTKRVEQQVVDT